MVTTQRIVLRNPLNINTIELEILFILVLNLIKPHGYHLDQSVDILKLFEFRFRHNTLPV